MAKDPAFLFYPGDWLLGTLGMTFDLKGAYMELLMLQFNRGHMSSDMCAQVVGQERWTKLQSKFTQDENNLWFNPRLELEKTKRKGFVDSRKNNLTGANQYTIDGQKEAHTTSHKKARKSKHTTSRMENENENINRVDIENKIEYDGSFAADVSLHINLQKLFIYEGKKRDKIVTWDGRKGKSINGIIDKLTLHFKNKNSKTEPEPQKIFDAFKHIITHLPEFYERSFEINDVNSGFDRIINTIKSAAKTGNGKGKADNANVSSMFAEIHRQRRASSAAKDAVN